MTSGQTVESCIYKNGHDNTTHGFHSVNARFGNGGRDLWLAALDMAEVTHCNL